MADERDRKQDDGAEGTAGAQKSNKALLWGILAVIVLINGALAYLLVMGTMKKVAPKEDATEAADTTVTAGKKVVASNVAYSDPPLEAIVNVAGTDGMRFLKAVVVMEYDSKEYKNLGVELTNRHALFKDALVDMLSGMKLEELEAPDARQVIRKRFLSKVNGMLPEKKIGKISNVYLTEFIMQ